MNKKSMTDRLGGSMRLNSAGLLMQLMENIPDVIYFKDHESRFIMINEAGAKWMGFEHPDDAIGKTDFDR